METKYCYDCLKEFNEYTLENRICKSCIKRYHSGSNVSTTPVYNFEYTNINDNLPPLDTMVVIYTRSGDYEVAKLTSKNIWMPSGFSLNNAVAWILIPQYN